MPVAQRRQNRVRSRAQSPAAGRALGRAREAHQRGLRAGNAGRPAIAVRHLRSGLKQLGWTEPAGPVAEPHRALAARLLMSLAHFEAEQGRTEYGLTLLDRAEGLSAPADRGILISQRGLLLMRTWRDSDALPLFDEAVPLLLAAGTDAGVLAQVLLNRGFSRLNLGDVRRARADFGWCQRIAASPGSDLVAAKAAHNLGYCDLLGGDIPAALQLFKGAAEIYQRTAPGNLPVLAMDKARALLAAGLAQDAASELDGAIASFRRQRLEQDLAEAELARSQAALAAGDLPAARRWAAVAQRRFQRRGNQACALLAELTRLRARSAAPAGQPALRAGEAMLLAQRLRDQGLGHDGDIAELIAARALIAAGQPAAAARRIAAVHRAGPGTGLEATLLRRLARAELAQREGRPGAALAELRAGLATVQGRRSRLGSIDLQTGAAALGADLATAGLALALERGSAPLVFAWLERSRAQAFRVRPVRPRADPQASAILAEVRQLSYLIRTAELSGHRDPAMLSRRAELQREIRERSWQASGLGEVTAQASIGDIGPALDQSGQALVALLARRGRMQAVVLWQGRVRLVGLGDYDVAAEAARRLTADLDSLAGRRLPARLEAVIRESIRHQADVLTAEIMAPLRPAIGADGAGTGGAGGGGAGAGVVLIPAGALAAVPWSLLPDLRGRPVTVCPSASAWLAAWRRGQAPGTATTITTRAATGTPAGSGAPPGFPLLVAGPDLRHAAREVTEIAKVYPGCRPLLAERSTVRATLRALDGAPLAHLAAHGHHDRENVLFSRLDLADGPLMAYDIQQLAAAPRQVVLSACDVGRTVVRPGEEILGFTAALLYVGTATVISSVTRVADEEAVGMMTGYHRALRGGARPAEALATAALSAPLSTFVCFGSG